MAMLLITSNRSKQLLSASFIGDVCPADLQKNRQEVVAELAGLAPGFHYLADFSQLVSMSPECAPELGLTMELLGKAGVGMVVRVIPDPSKDIGMNILTVFHYPTDLKVVTCQNLAEALQVLGL
jgi:hypothetical protein